MSHASFDIFIKREQAANSADPDLTSPREQADSDLNYLPKP